MEDAQPDISAAAYHVVQVTSSSTPGGKVRGLQAWDAARNIDAITGNFTGTAIGPGTGSSFWREAQFRVGLRSGLPAAARSGLNDWSYQRIATDRNAPAKTPFMPVYEAGKLIFGQVPAGSLTPAPAPAPAPTPVPAPAPTPVPAPTTGIAVSYALTSGWGTGFNGGLEIRNTGPGAINGWTMVFDLKANIVNIWNALIVSHVGTRYAVRNAGWSGTIAAGATISFGFQAEGIAGELPSNKKVNGIPVP